MRPTDMAVSAGRYRDLTKTLWPYVTEDQYLDLVLERDDLIEERDGLRAENERLRAALGERDPAAPARRPLSYGAVSGALGVGRPRTADSGATDAQPYTIAPAKYAKRMMAIRCAPDGTGFKTRAARLAEVVARGRYSNRERAYILSSAAAARFEKLYSEGYDGEIMGKSLIPPAP